MTDENTEYVSMWNNKGEVIQIPASATIEDLLKMGVKDIRFGKPGEPLEDGWWASPKYEGCGHPK